MRRGLLSVLCIITVVVPVDAWNSTGHMTVAYIAYQRLNSSTRVRVDALLKRNPEYFRWIANSPAGQEGLVAFLNASIWPDCIKGDSCPGYVADGPDNGNSPPSDASGGQNIGYADHAMHKYWHFIDLPFSPNGVPTKPAPAVNAATQIVRMRMALRSADSDDIKSYDIAWLAHLVGDIHQPLHAIQRFTAQHPNGDNGGNLVRFCDAPCDPPDNLHAYWDNLIGDQTDVAAIRSLGTGLLSQPEPVGATNTDVSAWSRLSAELAKEFVYTSPISAGNDLQARLSPRPDTLYEARAHKVARQQVLLAGYRLAYLLNQNLK